MNKSAADLTNPRWTVFPLTKVGFVNDRVSNRYHVSNSFALLENAEACKARHESVFPSKRYCIMPYRAR